MQQNVYMQHSSAHTRAFNTDQIAFEILVNFNLMNSAVERTLLQHLVLNGWMVGWLDATAVDVCWMADNEGKTVPFVVEEVSKKICKYTSALEQSIMSSKHTHTYLHIFTYLERFALLH